MTRKRARERSNRASELFGDPTKAPAPESANKDDVFVRGGL
jgi:hypothetical protein